MCICVMINLVICIYIYGLIYMFIYVLSYVHTDFYICLFMHICMQSLIDAFV